VFHLKPNLSEDELNQQKTSALQAANALMLIGQHPNIVQCYPPLSWEADKIVLPFLTLRDLLNEGLNFSLSDRLMIFRQICHGLTYMHGYQIYYRSLSPENVVITRDKRVKLIGFEFAKIGPRDSFTHNTVGTKFLKFADSRYVAPEITARPHAASIRSDIYSAGIILFELVTGRFPSQEAVEGSRDCPRDLCEIFLRMCAPEPDQRYRSIEEVLFDLELIS
jgi:serine/threonine protein kinase